MSNGSLTVPSTPSCTQKLCSLLEMDAQTCNAWQGEDFKKAEEALSELIEVHVNDHKAFTNRALVRARELRWDAALEDAQMSIKIQPSVIGYVALSVVLCGQGNGEDALRALDLGFIDSNGYVNPVRFLLLMKSIIIFNNGRCDEGMARITALIKAHMYVQLAMAAMKAQAYDTSANVQRPG
ncbi:hypothetical protein BJ138DRAFT_1106342 [Hygrophoropsis aurantiaca]|uniref:Uncharacterized protein n=1 Tax=Hygrophoropsis aurantiaca TaxID=72124 RepID=A0ACB7ZV18_9AGAM|nr:hypothetical protein BJ138DRAFT_1106342 [Hygrophoropsis aurantiaca]